MSELVEKIKSIYYEIKNNYVSENLEQDELKLEMDRVDHFFVDKILKNVVEDKDKMELLELFDNENDKASIISSLESDEEKIKLLAQIEDDNNKMWIIKSFKNEPKKIQYLEECKRITNRCEILLTCGDKELLGEFFLQNMEMKKEMVQLLYRGMSDGKINTTYWEYMKNAGLENQVISHLLVKTRYKILSQMNEEMKQDVEKYLGKSIPENIDELSKYEKVGIDKEVLKEEVITDIKQLHIDDLEKNYLANCRPDKDNKKRIAVKDFVGTVSPTLNDEYNGKRIETWEDLTLGLKRWSFGRHSESLIFSTDENEPIGLQGIDGKYFVRYNGNHRMTMLKLRYLTEIERAKNDPKRIKEIDEEYQIEVTSAVNVPQDREEMIAIVLLSEINNIQKNDNEILELVENGQKVGYRIKEKDNEKIIRSKEELIDLFEAMKEELKKEPDKYNQLKKKMESYKIKEENKDILLHMLDMKKETEPISTELEPECAKMESNLSEIESECIKKKLPSLRDFDSPNIKKEPQSLMHLEPKSSYEVLPEENKDVDTWLNRLGDCDSKIRKLPDNLKQKFIIMKSAITQVFKQVLKTRTQEDKIPSNKPGEKKDEGRI